MGWKSFFLKEEEFFEKLFLKNPWEVLKFLNKINPKILEEISFKKAELVFSYAYNNCPAYRDFIKKNEKGKKTPFSEIPFTDKENYIKKYSYESRCLNGKLPLKGNIDQSAGTTGKPTEWIRNYYEEDFLFLAVKFEYEYLFHQVEKPIIILSCWSSGPWATGVKFCSLVEKLALVKNVGPDIQETIETLKTFGNKYNYVISGYPPFIKRFADQAEKEINLKKYKIHLIHGGEGVSLEWENYLRKKLGKKAKIVSSYGCSDIDIGIGFETPFCQLIRRLCYQNKKLCRELFNQTYLPMVFQYNPLLHYIENYDNPKTKKREILITFLDVKAASPKIKYNLHDEGGKIEFEKMKKILEKYYPSYSRSLDKEKILNLPFLYIFGRSDGTISLAGANVYPQQIEMALHSDKDLLAKTHRFKIGMKYTAKENIKFIVKIELMPSLKPSKSLKEKYEDLILKSLLKLNEDYRESYEKDPSLRPYVELHKYQHSLFAKDNKKVKNIYLC